MRQKGTAELTQKMTRNFVVHEIGRKADRRVRVGVWRASYKLITCIYLLLLLMRVGVRHAKSR